MPYGILTRKPHTGFRTGKWMTRNSEHLAVKFGLQLGPRTRNHRIPHGVLRHPRREVLISDSDRR